MLRRMTVDTYVAGEETNRPQELAFGVLREPAAPSFDHQVIVGRLHVRLDAHVRRHRAGRVVTSPVDVVLDRQRALIVQPDVLFVAAERLHICTDRVWGPPDLVVEVLSTANRRHDRAVKCGWYRAYGVRECWIVDPVARTIEIVDMARDGDGPALFDGEEPVRSRVLPGLRLRPADVFNDRS